MNTTRFVSLLAAVVLASGCTHSMQVKNLDDYMISASAPRPLMIRLQNAAAEPQSAEYFQHVHTALATNPHVARVLLHDDPDVPVDAVVTVNAKPEYKGSGANYLVTFPGFLLFTHAWNGFLYKANIVTELGVQMANGGRALTRELHTEYDMRHCDMERGSAASSGWWMPGWGASNLLVGAFMVPYDQDATPEFMRVAGPAYGSYVANSIVETISQEVTASGSADRSLSTCLRFEGTTGTPVASCRIRS